MDHEERVTERTDYATGPNREVVSHVRHEEVGTPEERGFLTVNRVIYFILGVIEVLLLLRFILKLAGANPASGFVDLVYVLTAPLLGPFNGIFSTATNDGLETTSVFEPAVIIAMIIYALVAWGISYLLSLLLTKKSPDEVAQG